MARRIGFVAHTSTIPDYFLNSLQDFVQALAANFVLTLASSSSIQVVAGAGDQSAAVSIGGKWRFVTATVNAAHPGGAAGDYDVFVTATDDNFTGTDPNIDLTTYSFGLSILPSGNTPGSGIFRKVGTCRWEGSVGAGGISGIVQTAGGAGPPAAANGDDGTPAMDGTAGRGASLHYARADHVHPSDTSRAPLASPALTGAPTAPTAAVDTNTTQLATTAFVLAQAGSAAPGMDGAAAAGTSTRFARADHVHPTDTSRAPVASPTFTGVPQGPTAAVDTNNTQLATTQFVLSQASASAPAMDAAATVGTSTRFARADHVHPTDTSRAPLASPTFTGTPAAPTAAVDTSTTQLATTAFVIAQASAVAPSMDGTTNVGTSTRFARADHVHPTDSSRAPLASPVFTGTPAAPTPVSSDNSTTLATTAFVQAVLAAAVAGATPTGVMTEFAGTAAPSGWLLCQGQAISRTTYAALFALIGTAYGSGDGTTTFNIPDMRGAVPVGQSAAGTFATRGAKVGAETHSVSLAEMPSHDHTAVTSATSGGTPSGTVGGSVSVTVNNSAILTTGGESVDHSHSGTTAAGGVGGKELNATAALQLGTSGTTFQGPTNALLADSHAHSFGTGGRNVGHTHDIAAHAHSGSGSFSGIALAGNLLPTHTHAITAQGGGTAMSLVQPSVVVNYIIKT